MLRHSSAQEPGGSDQRRLRLLRHLPLLTGRGHDGVGEARMAPIWREMNREQRDAFERRVRRLFAKQRLNFVEEQMFEAGLTMASPLFG